jgi:O-antigen ligase
MRLLAFLIAVAGPFLLNEVVLPNTTHPNQILAVFGWGLVLLARPAPAIGSGALRALRPLLLALALVCAGCVLSMAMGGVPSSPGVAMLMMQLIAVALALHGAALGGSRPEAAFRLFAIALVVGGVCGAVIGVVQIFDPVATGNHWFAALAQPGRAIGNLGQANLFSDTQIWALAALVPLMPPADRRDGRARAWRGGLLALGMLLLLGVILSASRTGMVGIIMLSLWGAFDRNLPKSTRVALMCAVAVAAAMWWGVDLWAHGNPEAADLGYRPGSGIRTSRLTLWKHALLLISQQPLLGVGWGQYSFAWALTPMTPRPTTFDDNAHNLVLELAVELGVPAALAIMALLCAALVRSVRQVRRLSGQEGIAGRSALMIILYIGVHSMLEYPLWYTFFLFPTAWVWGLTLGWGAQAGRTPEATDASRSASMPPERAWRIGGVLLTAAGVVTWLSYMTIVDVYRPNYVAVPMGERIARAEASPLFSNYADRMIALQAVAPVEVLPEIQRAFRANPNGGVMFVWINALESHGDDDKARYVAARLREFDLSGPAPFFAPCDDPSVVAKPFQCLPPSRPLTWRDFR